MYSNEIIAQGWEIVRTDGADTIFKAANKFFAMCRWGEEFHIYQAIKEPCAGDYFQFLGNGKVGKSFRTVKAFVENRIA